MKSHKNKMIGIVGGMGPYAGLDLARKIFDLIQSKILLNWETVIGQF